MLEDLLQRLNLTEYEEQIRDSEFTDIKDGKIINLDLGFCDADTLPDDAFVDHPEIETLNLSAMGLTHLPKTIFDPLPHLQVLGLKSNDLTSIDVSYFRNNKELELINLEFNPLETKFTIEGVRIIF